MPRILYALSAVILLFAGTLNSKAQDDLGLYPECHCLYMQADEAVGKSSFDSLSREFHKLAIAKGDKNSILQYHLLELRHLCMGSSKEQVLEAMEQLKEKALEMGELKYFFNAYTRTAMYMEDVEHDETAVLELLLEMLSEATKYNSEYGFYEGHRYLALICWKQGDFINARRHALKAYGIYSETKDPIIKNETIIVRTLTELSETYKADNDSSLLFLEEARKVAAIGVDSLRCNYCEARYWAKKNDLAKYAFFRDKVREDDRSYTRYYPQGDLMFGATEAAAAGNWETFHSNVEQFDNILDLKYFAELASLYGNVGELSQLEERIIRTIFKAHSSNQSDAIARLAASMGNMELSHSLDATKHKLAMSNRLIIASLSAFLILLILFMVVYIHKRHNEDREKQKLITKLQKSRDEADKANRMKTTFVQNMSHEIRTPLNALVGFAQLLSLPDGSLTPEEKEEYGDIVTNSGEVLTGLIDDILNMADIETGNYKIRISRFKPASVCAFALRIVEGRVSADVKLVFENRVSEDLSVNSDMLRVQQILTNFLTNAIKNTESGTITIGCTTEEAPGYVSFYVADTGVGVPPEKADVIFDRYVKLDNFKPGTGLGLSICRILASKLQGLVYLDRNYSPGARFVLNIPL